MQQLDLRRNQIFVFLFRALWVPIVLFYAYLIAERYTYEPIRIQHVIFISCVIALFTVLYWISCITAYLNKNPVTTILHRFYYQFQYGILPPLAFFALLRLMLAWFSNDLKFNWKYLFQDSLPLFIFLYIANCFYLIYYRLVQVNSSDKGWNRSAPVIVYFKGNRMKVPTKDIALIYQQNQINWLVNFKGEEFVLTTSLKDVYHSLNPFDFFKVNRNNIVNKQCIQHIRSGSFGKIEISLYMNHIVTTVSKDRAVEFRKWYLAR